MLGEPFRVARRVLEALGTAPAAPVTHPSRQPASDSDGFVRLPLARWHEKADINDITSKGSHHRGDIKGVTSEHATTHLR